MTEVTKKTKKTRKKVAEIKVVKDVVKTVPEVPKFLHHSDLTRLQVLGEEVRSSSLEMALNEQIMKNMVLQKEKIELEIEKQRQKVVSVHQAYVDKSKERSGFVKEIAPIYGAKEGENFGYIPDTGEVVLNPK